MYINVNELTQREQYRIWRLRRKITLQNVAEYIGVTYNLLSMWERGRANISETTLYFYNDFIEKTERKYVNCNKEQIGTISKNQKEN